MKKARYICFEGTEGVGKTTQTQKLVDYLRSKGYKVLQTKEPGTPHSPLTMVLRGIMLDNQYDAQMTRLSREYISQAIRSIHLERVIVPAFYEYDYIIQDRGILSGYAYGQACDNDFTMLKTMATQNVDAAAELTDCIPIQVEHIYDKVIYLTGNVSNGLTRAKATKQEFATGDAMESRGTSFLEKAGDNMFRHSKLFNSCTIEVDGKSIDEVHNEIITKLEVI